MSLVSINKTDAMNSEIRFYVVNLYSMLVFLYRLYICTRLFLKTMFLSFTIIFFPITSLTSFSSSFLSLSMPMFLSLSSLSMPTFLSLSSLSTPMLFLSLSSLSRPNSLSLKLSFSLSLFSLLLSSSSLLSSSMLAS